jgi:hypothetical protein
MTWFHAEESGPGCSNRCFPWQSGIVRKGRRHRSRECRVGSEVRASFKCVTTARLQRRCELEKSPRASLFDEIKRLRDDTFHYGSARDKASIERMRAAMRDVADELGPIRSLIATIVPGTQTRSQPP